MVGYSSKGSDFNTQMVSNSYRFLYYCVPKCHQQCGSPYTQIGRTTNKWDDLTMCDSFFITCILLTKIRCLRKICSNETEIQSCLQGS